MTTVNTYKDIAASAVISGYKWLTSTLLSAQQGFALRPFFTVQVIDDLILPSAQFSGTGTPLGNGSMASAPDGKVFAVGNDAGVLHVVWDNALNAVAGVWRNSVTLNTAGDNFDDVRNVFSIQISDSYKGVYRICVWYFGNFINDGSDLQIILQYSDDAGITWTKSTLSVSPVGSLPNTNPPSPNPSLLGNISIASFKPVLGSDNKMKMGCFYLKPNSGNFVSGFSGYDIYYVYGDSSGLTINSKWYQNVNSYDWTIHSLGAYYLNGIQYCTFSGFRNVLDSIGINANYSIWVASLLNYATVAGKNLFSSPVAAMPVGSASAINQNSFIYPSGSVINGMAYITFQATVVDSLSQTSQGASAQVVTTHVNYQYVQSDNGLKFSYPSVFVGTDGSEFNSGSYASFVTQGGYAYLGGGAGYLWELIQNNIVADVSADVIGYQIQETAGQPSSVTLSIANANNKWVGSAPTGAGASAIARNRKIAVWQGFYNSNGIPELVPHSLHYIDDIQQVVTSSKNDVTLIGRDFYKKLKTTVSKYSYQFIGPTLFSDIFDGTFMSNWNQIAGTWLFDTSGISGGTPPLLRITDFAGGEAQIMLTGTNENSYGALTSVFFTNPSVSNAGSRAYFYAMYIDANNWLRLEINTNDGQSWKVTKNVSGTPIDLDSGTLPTALDASGNHAYGIFIRRYDYFKFNFTIAYQVSPSVGNTLQYYNPTQTSYLFKSGSVGEFDLSGVFSASTTWQAGFTVGLGSVSLGPSRYRFFKHSTYNNPNNLGSIFRSIARIAGIFSFKTSYTWRELLFLPNFTGTFSVTNRKLNVLAGNQAIAQSNQPFANGEVSFKAKIAISNTANPAGFSFIFRKANDISGQDDYYKFHVQQLNTNNGNQVTSVCRFERFVNSLGATFNFFNSPYDVTNNPITTIGTMGIDLTQWHTYRVFMVDGWMYAFIDDQMVAAWNDNNINVDYQTTGKWGFESDTNTSIQVKEITTPDFWKSVPVFSLNPGDDTEGAIESLIQSLRAWFFSDLFGRFKVKFLGSNDSSTYTYNTQLFQQNVDSSDKEYVSQVVVYGNGVSATARNTNLLPGVITREEVVVDYSIQTVQDAQTRANNELINSNQFRNQYSPKQFINVGSELFDAVTIVNTGNNTTGVNGTTRVYSQDFQQGGGNNNSDYSLELQTGNL